MQSKQIISITIDKCKSIVFDSMCGKYSLIKIAYTETLKFQQWLLINSACT